MWWTLSRLLLLSALELVFAMSARCEVGTIASEAEARAFLGTYYTEGEPMFAESDEALWQTGVNATAENYAKLNEISQQIAAWKKTMAQRAAAFNTTGFSQDVRRQFAFIKDIGIAAMPDDDKLEQLTNVKSAMGAEFVNARLCRCVVNETVCLDYGGVIDEIRKTRDARRMRALYLGWSNAVGPKLRRLFPQYVSLSNEAVRSLGYNDLGDYWRSAYESETFEEDVDALFNELKPLYTELHAYVRRRLKAHFGDRMFPRSGHIPAHLLEGSWTDIMMPSSRQPNTDVTDEMIRQNYTVDRMFRSADDFFRSLGLPPMPEEFWERSMLERPSDGRPVDCHAAALGFRIKMCAEVNQDYFSIIHHEMGHVQYNLLYKDLPDVYRWGANPGFHEAVGDLIWLSVNTPKHLHKIGLLPTLVENDEADLNFLMSMALNRLLFLPYFYAVEKWRWSVFRGDTTPDRYNRDWWNLRCELEGVSPPGRRSEKNFDPAYVWHIATNHRFMSYFVSFVLQFQFHKALCDVAGHVGPLHRCDIFNSTAAGDKLRAMLSMGRSKPWTVPLQAMTGTARMSAAPMMEYFRPLSDFLKSENDEDKGWRPWCPVRSSTCG